MRKFEKVLMSGLVAGGLGGLMVSNVFAGEEAMKKAESCEFIVELIDSDQPLMLESSITDARLKCSPAINDRYLMQESLTRNEYWELQQDAREELESAQKENSDKRFNITVAAVIIGLAGGYVYFSNKELQEATVQA